MAPFIGILSLDTRFPRIPGDAGNPGSYHLPARVHVVPGAGSPEIVRERPSEALVAAFRAGAETLTGQGAGLIVSTCGFLVSVQEEIARGLGVPVVLSGLAMLPLARHATGSAPVGVLTASAAALTEGAIRAAGGQPGEVRVQGLEGSALFAGTFLAPKSVQHEGFDRAEMAAEVRAAALALVECAPEIRSIVLECGNLPPYAAEIREATGRPVWSILDAARLVTGKK